MFSLLFQPLDSGQKPGHSQLTVKRLKRETETWVKPVESSGVPFVLTGLNHHPCLLNVFLVLHLISGDGKEGGTQAAVVRALV